MKQKPLQFPQSIIFMVLLALNGPIPSLAALPGEDGWEVPLGLDGNSIIIPNDNPLTNEKVELGKLLFFDKRLSKNNTIACASCHLPHQAFTDGTRISKGIHGLRGLRNAPASINRLFSSSQFWDGRAPNLEKQSILPLVNAVEHGFAYHGEYVAKLKTIAGYRKLFQQAFHKPITKTYVAQAIASFQRTLVSGNSPYDQYDYGGNDTALTPGAVRGLNLFLEKAQCAQCHFGFNFTDEKFHNLGVDWDTTQVDLGRFKVTKNPKDIGAFKTPTLREISRTAPYMHNGQFATLRQVIDFYDHGGIQNPYQDKTVIPLNLTDQEKEDLIEFLQSLNGEGWQTRAPTAFPQ